MQQMIVAGQMSISIISLVLIDDFVEFVSWKKINDLREDKLTFNHNLAVLKPQNYYSNQIKKSKKDCKQLYINDLNNIGSKLTHH